MNTPPFSKFVGSSLVITMAFLVILTILAVGINETIRMERTSSNLYAERTSAAMLSQNAVEVLVAKLQQNTADVERHWLSQPGQLVVGAEEDDGSTSNGDSRKILTGAKKPEESPSSTDPRIVYLHSGSVTTGSFPGQEVLNPPNLNVSTFQDPSSSLITNRADTSGSTVKMYVRWNYVRQDGSVEAIEQPDLTNKTNPIVGRYAYWADDESAKVNYNIAWKREFDETTLAGKLPSGNPSRVTLSALDVFSGSSALMDKLHQFVTADNYNSIAQHLFNSPADARQGSTDVASALQQNKFEVTHYNHDPDTTFFNEQRIVLTTKASRAAERPYLNILADESADPGYTANLDQDKLNTVLFGSGGTAIAPKSPGLIYYLSRTDWPIVSGTSSFQSKYFNGDKTQLVQFALNAIDYVRSAESTLPVVEPMRGKINSKNVFLGEWLNANSSIRGAESTFKGLTRAPMITEMGLLVSTNTTTPQARIYVEVYLPKRYGVASVNLVDDFKYLFQVSSDTGTRLLDDGTTTPDTISSANLVSGNLILTAGSRTVFFYTLNFKTAADRPTPGTKVALRVGITRHDATPLDPTGTTNRQYPIIEIVPIGDPSDNPEGTLYTVLPYTALKTASLPSTSLQTDDPRVSGIAKDWVEKAATWGTDNPIASPINITPEQDTDTSGAISQASLYMPPPATTSGNLNGVVSSTGELGYIHTGMQVTSTGSAGVPWRTLRLQPSSQPVTMVPDWAFMDLFTVPLNVATTGTICAAANAVFAPHSTATGGRVNINANSEPISTAGDSFGGMRLLPLEAVLRGARKNSTDSTETVSATESQTIAQNIYNRTLATQGKQFGYLNGYDTQGEVVEIKGVADGGEASEELVRQIANLITARGDVFSVYTIGQALKQTPQGKLVVTSENRQQAMIERYLDSSTNKIRFKTVYCRPLTP
ncbi:MAG: hypothetical protein ACFUZC_10975 [Chthoniobacteraceae bacterium]